MYVLDYTVWMPLWEHLTIGQGQHSNFGKFMAKHEPYWAKHTLEENAKLVGDHYGFTITVIQTLGTVRWDKWIFDSEEDFTMFLLRCG